MDTTTAPLPVIIRTFRDGRDVIAFFPTVPASSAAWYDMQSYQHTGQHGAADYAGCLPATRPPTGDELAYMLAALHDCGYRRLRVYRRETCYHRAARQLEYQRIAAYRKACRHPARRKPALIAAPPR